MRRWRWWVDAERQGLRIPPWHWRWILIPLRERVWYPIKRWWYAR